MALTTEAITPLPTAEDRIRWFREAGLGMFIHWGLYSLLGHGEWAQWREDINPRDYARLAEKFTADQFDADAWAALAQEGGAKYVVLTTRHHDGFALWNSKVSNFTSTRSAARRDFIAEYVEAVRRRGLKVGLYYSPMDWSWYGLNTDRCTTSPFAWREFVERGPDIDPEAWEDFRAYVHAQMRELMTQYGKIDLLWYDGCWYQTKEQWHCAELNAMVRRFQPHIVINDRSGYPEDYSTPENEIPLNLDPRQRPFEVCMCMNDTWGFIPGDKNYKSAQQCLNDLLRVRSAGGNLLLNTSPDGRGRMPDQNSEIMRQLGCWLRVNGSSVYGCGWAEMCTHGTGFFAQPGIVTHNPLQRKLYYHILRWLGSDEHCVKIAAKILEARLVSSGALVSFMQSGRMVYFKGLPAVAPDGLDTVIELSYEQGSEHAAWTKNFV